ncbi:Uncharacterized protein SCF082_LOCUS3147, partial [Durusdinium trenchii]
MKFQLALTLAALGAIHSNANDGVCQGSCQAVCKVTGDPHVTDFFGESTFHTPPDATEANFYTYQGDFTIKAPITTVSDNSGDVFHLIYTLHFGSTVLKASEVCPNNKTDVPHVQLEHSFGDKGFAWIDVYCATSPTKSKLTGAFLNFEVHKMDFTDDPTATFETLEKDSTGFCMGQNEGRRLRGVRSLSGAGPTCATLCRPDDPCDAINDPHIKTFFNQKYSITNSQEESFVLYEMPGNTTYDHEHDVSKFVVKIWTESAGRIHKIDFGDEVITTANCTNGKNTLPLGLREVFDDGDILQMVVQCTNGMHSDNPQPIFLNVNSLVKYDFASGGSTDFRTVEEEQGSFGLCISQCFILSGLTPRPDATPLHHASSSDSCQAVCEVTGDPHVTDFFGESTFHTPPDATEANFYTYQGDFTIKAPITTVTDSSGDEFHLIYTLNFGDTTLKASEVCPNNQTDVPHVQLEHSFGDKGFVWIDVYCATSPHKPKLTGAFLNFNVYKMDFTDDPTATFETLEKDSTGFCMGQNEGRRLRGVRSLSGAGPTCATLCRPSAPCSAINDPHIQTFFNKDYSITNSQEESFVLYEMPGNTTYDHDHDVSKFVVKIWTESAGRIHKIDFGDEVITTANCTNGKNTLPLGLREVFDDGDILQMVVQCTNGMHSDNPQPIFLNVNSLVKYDFASGGSTDFRTVEEEQ